MKKNTSWILTKENSIVLNTEVIGYHKEWLDEDLNPNGTRIGFFQEGIDEPFFISASWDNNQDCYDSDEGLLPTHYMHIPSTDGLN